jgi:hypothetical protein
MRVTGGLERWLQAWLQGAVQETGDAGHEPPPPASVLCPAPTVYLRGWRAARVFLVRAFLLCIGITIVLPLIERGVGAFTTAFVPFVTPLAFLAAVVPVVFRRKPRVQPSATTETAPTLVESGS